MQRFEVCDRRKLLTKELLPQKRKGAKEDAKKGAKGDAKEDRKKGAKEDEKSLLPGFFAPLRLCGKNDHGRANTYSMPPLAV